MSKHKKPQVDYNSYSEDLDWHPVLTELIGKGFACTLTRMKRGTLLARASVDYVIFDLGADSITIARHLLKQSPTERGRIIIVGPAPQSGEQPDGVSFSSPENLAETVQTLHARLGSKEAGDASPPD